MHFTNQEKEKINKLLEEGKKMQAENGNKRYTKEEMNDFFNTLVKGENHYIQNRI